MAEPGAEAGEARPVAQQQPGRAEGACPEDDAPGPHAPEAVLDRVQEILAVALARLEVLAVADLEPVVVPRDAVGLAAAADVGARVLGGREVGEVRGLLGAVVAADVALAAHPACGTCGAVHVQLGLERLAGRRLGVFRRPERDGERRALEVEVQAPCGALQRAGLGDRVVARRVDRVALGALHRLGLLVVRVEVLARDQPALAAVVHERLGVLAQHDVGVDQRSATEPGRDDRVDPREAQDLVEAVPAARRVPERAAHVVRRARERARRPRPPALEHQHRPSGLREPARDGRSAEARADDDDVESLGAITVRHLRPPRRRGAGGRARSGRIGRCGWSSPARVRGGRPRP